MNRAGFVLTGGRSSRMGRDKPLLPFRGKTLVEHIAAEVREAAGSVTLVGGAERFRSLNLPAIADIKPDCGPLGGIVTALEFSTAEWNLVVACDMPAVSAGFLRSLLDDAERTGCECLVPVSPAGRIEPLCAVYRRTCLPELLRALDAGTRKMTDILEALNAVKRSVPESGFFRNLNTPEEWVTHEHSSGSESQGVHG